ncbi:hypothetical protein QVD17_22987 [Tagetes erecta]|uniref:Uncharacterized protein n=1 Tax=Tagetes erecta TaxID=13708 RepID=A0AAD8NU02_TARER|nr:hypothetical protein QVD17_22987 [Tagetes erecta]
MLQEFNQRSYRSQLNKHYNPRESEANNQKPKSNFGGRKYAERAMEIDKPSSSSSSPPYSTGAGGKFRKPPVSRKRPSTPYDRPSLSAANNKSNEPQSDGDSWLSKLVVNPARRLIVSGATRMLPSFFSRSEPSSADQFEYDSSGDRDNEDVEATVDALGDAKHTLELGVPSSSRDAGPSNERDNLKGSLEHADVQQGQPVADFDQIENVLKGKQFSRDESNRLMEILKSRLVDDSNVEGEKTAAIASVIPQGQDKMNELDCEIPSLGKQYDVETPMPRLLSNIHDEVAASPIDIAKAYMGGRASESAFNTHSNISTNTREQKHTNLFPSKSHFLTPSTKASTCWPGAMVQDHRAYLTPQIQRSRYGLHNFPRTPYSRTKPKLNQLQGDRSSNISLTTFQQSYTPNPRQMKTSSDVMDGGYGSVGPIRGIRNKLVSEPYSEGPRSFSSAHIASSSNASRSFVPVFQKNPIIPAISNVHKADKYKQAYKNNTISTGPSNETVKKILDQLDRHKPTPKEKAAELKLPTEWKRSPSESSSSIMPVLASVTGPNLSDNRCFLKGTDDGISFKDPKKASNAATRAFTSVNDASAGPSSGFTNMGFASEKSTVTNIREKEKSQPWSFDNEINGQDLPRKRPSQPILNPISFKRPDPQQVMSSDNNCGFTFSFSANTSSASEPPTPSIMPSVPPTAASQSKKLPVMPTYSFGTKKSGEQVVFSFPSTSSDLVDDDASDPKFDFGSDRKGVSFGSIGSDAIVIS